MVPPKMLDAPDVQLVCVVWGDRYGAAEINHLFRSAAEKSASVIACVLITDQELAGLDNHIVVNAFPTFVRTHEQMKDGCRLKLAMFAPDILLPDVPAIFFDLDTMIAGDVADLAAQILKHRSVFLLKNHAVPFWRMQKPLRPLLGGRYYFGNSSVVGFIPRHCEFIYHQFNNDISLFGRAGADLPKHLCSDERYISYAACDRLRCWNGSQVAAFHREFMSPIIWLAELRKKMPWRQNRRRKLIALTFIGSTIKPREIASFRSGQIVCVKQYRVRWSFDAFQQYWRKAVHGSSESETEQREAA